jgi:hypothetical protein
MTKEYFGELSKYLFSGDTDFPLWRPNEISLPDIAEKI